MCCCSQKKPLEPPGYLSGNPWRPNALSLPCRYQGCVFRPLPQERWGHPAGSRHGGVIRHRVPTGQEHGLSAWWSPPKSSTDTTA